MDTTGRFLAEIGFVYHKLNGEYLGLLPNEIGKIIGKYTNITDFYEFLSDPFDGIYLYHRYGIAYENDSQFFELDDIFLIMKGRCNHPTHIDVAFIDIKSLMNDIEKPFNSGQHSIGKNDKFILTKMQIVPVDFLVARIVQTQVIRQLKYYAINESPTTRL